MQPRQPGTPPLGQLLVDRGVITSTQLYQISLEQRVTGKPLGEIILERGLASSELLENTSDGGARPPDDFATRSEGPAENQDETPRGLRARAARRLDGYLAATAAELDERGEVLKRRSVELEQKAEELASAESALDERTQRLRHLDIHDEDASRRIDHLIQVVAEREAKIEALTEERDQARARFEQETARRAEELASMATAITATQDELRRLQVEHTELVAERPRPTSHLLLVPGSGCYALVERPGPPPDVGVRISQGRGGERRFVVARLGDSPLPLDARTCAYLQPE